MHTFETARLSMRTLQPDDEAMYCACYTDRVLMKHISEPLTPEAALSSFKAALKANSKLPIRQRTWVIRDAQSQSVIGLLGLNCEHAKPEPVNAQIGAIIFDRFQNRGFAAEAIAELVNIAFRHSNLASLYTQHLLHHRAANGLMEKLGFQHIVKNPGDAYTQWLLHRADWQRRTQN